MTSPRPARPRTPQANPPEVVDPRWILKAVGAVMAVGLLCAYITLCLFFYYGQWEFVLHPSRTVSTTPGAQELSFQSVKFGEDLAGWWIPSDLPTDPTVLVLHSETGSMSDAVPLAKALHSARLNVLLFDYRGYGQSGGRHPTERMMLDDSEQALRFLEVEKHATEPRALVMGVGLGASLATRLVANHPQLAGLMLLNADGDTTSRVEADQRSRIIPVGLLFHERFALADPLHSSKLPKLLISYTHGAAPEIAQRAGFPKLTAELPPNSGPETMTSAIRRFLDTYIGGPAPALHSAN